MLSSLLVANRGEIARRIVRTARRLQIRTVAVHSEAGAGLPFVTEADEAVLIGPANPAQSYRNTEAILAAAKATGAEAIHPGYGFLSENAAFAKTVLAAAGVPVAPGTTDPATTVESAVEAATAIGFPVMVKAAAGGGGMGMAVASDEAGLCAEYDKVRGFAERMFGDGSVLIERYFPRVRHVEVQILGLADGRVVALGERECSVQRRNQKLVEETPSPALTPGQRADLLAAAVRAGEAVGYRNAGTVECLFDPTTGQFFFLEMNTRLQVEHPVTEAVFGIDLVEEQLRVAAGLAPTFDPAALSVTGHAIEVRVNAEDPKRFLPGPGAITTWVEPTGEVVRVDAGYTAGNTVTPSYDSLMAKLIVHGADRADALGKLRAAVAGFQIVGPKVNLPFFTELLDNAEFVSGDYDTGIVGRMR
ncbi:biotin carboxylase N-terminal domain-containing protein [Dactylosporangium sp. AC04546]|uniref:acetyl-CoA carboxylase biotin carboxylase subunit n=1 Tax=Dactylosporangium sp. AC04546 TaxID=2862460 RepID=UPI001EDD00B4|nr:biotin carboxylase N-terminal domain-containing protein [Dactylosporangium sp. AC04546]WVK83908.1 biotin carboxylase N-terminal domain-containing protein [Dactylosporangium sp. AC04546]